MDNLRTKISFALLVISCFLLPLLVPSQFSKVVVVFLVSVAVAGLEYKKLTNPLVYCFVGLFTLDLVGLLNSSNTQYSIAHLETALSLIVFPILLFVGKTQHSISRPLIAFASGVLLLNLASLFLISYDLWDPKNLQINLIEANNIIVKIHPAFLSMYISFCIFFIADYYFPLHKLDRVKLGWVLFSLSVLTVFLIWLNSRAGILAFVLSAIFFISYRWQGRTRWIGFAGLILFLVVLVSVPFSRYRFVEAPKMVLSSESGVNHNDPNVYPIENRLQIYKCDVELLKWPEIIYGYGTGDFRDELQKCFEANNYTAPLAENMDSHSEYFAQLHRHGIIGLGLFLALLIVPFRHALKYRSPLLGAFIILFAVTALFENVFSAQKGVTFFALFCPLLYIYAKQQYEARLAAQGTSEV
ncbi:MAG: O-antigen ligase family protein [Cyclobacteriaceae bacterium]